MKIKNKFIKPYADFIAGEISLQRRMKIIIDPSNGLAGEVMKSSLKKNKKIEDIYINDRPDGDFPAHGPNPSLVGSMDDIKSRVSYEKADAGFIFDGDGDRVFVIDDKGRSVHPDFLVKLYADIYSPEKIVVDRRIGWLVTKDLARSSSVKIIKSKVGHSHVKDAMNRNTADFGAEEAGHYYFNVEGCHIDSGAIMTAKMLTAVSALPSLSSWVDSQPQYFRFGEISFKVADRDEFMTRITKYAKDNGFKTDMEDGLSAERDDFHFNARPSANEPLVRMDAEAVSDDVLRKEVQMIQSLIQEQSENE